MALPAGATLTNATCVKARIEYPFRDQGDALTKVYHHTMQQKLTSYAPLDDDDTMTAATEKPENSPFADDADAFFVGDTALAEQDGGMVEWVRSFANIPQDLITPGGFYAFEFPDVAGGIFTIKDTTSESSSYNAGTFVLTITATLSALDAAEFTDGQYLSIYNPNAWTYERVVGTSTYSYTQTIFSGLTTKSVSTITLTIENFYHLINGVKTAFTSFSDNTPTEYSVKIQVSPDRNSTAVINSPSVISNRYVKDRNVESIQLNSKFELTSLTGLIQTQTSISSIPFTTAQYQAAALNEQSIPAENETIEHWRGNIYRLSQIFVKMK